MLACFLDAVGVAVVRGFRDHIATPFAWVTIADAGEGFAGIPAALPD